MTVLARTAKYTHDVMRGSLFSSNKKEDCAFEETDLPHKFIRNVCHDKVFEQTLPLVWPLRHYPHAELAAASIRMCESHLSQWPNERIIHQVRYSPIIHNLHIQLKSKVLHKIHI